MQLISDAVRGGEVVSQLSLHPLCQHVIDPILVHLAGPVIVAPVAVPSCSKPPLPPRLPTAPFSAGTPPRVRFVIHLDTHGAELVTHAI